MASFLIALTATTAAPTGDFVLDARAATGLKALLQLEKPLPGGVQLAAKIEKDHVRVQGDRAGKRVFAITLRHASRATKDMTRIGSLAIDPQPGPAPPRLLKALTARIRSGKGALSWRALKPRLKKAAPVRHDLHRIFDRALYAIHVGKPGEARALLKPVSIKISDGMRLRAARLWRQLGDEARMRAMLAAPLNARYALAARLLKESKMDLEPLFNGPLSCRLTSLLGVLRDLERFDDARTLSTRIRKADPTCEMAWAIASEEAFRSGDFKAGLRIAAQATEALPKSRMARMRYAGALHKAKRFAEAAQRYESLAREDIQIPGVLRLALSSMLRDVKGRKAHEQRLEARLAKDPSDLVSQFLRGVLHHYENEFEASDKLLMPLQTRLKGEQRLDIYLAMNAFNLGRRPDALARLNRGAEIPMPDADIFYCRAEILRDTDRKQALADLNRYLATSERSLVSNVEKQTRVKALVAALEGCLKTGATTCVADWEHPRLDRRGRGPAAGTAPTTPPEDGLGSDIYFFIAGLLLLVFLLRLRHRRTAGESEE